MMWIAQVGHVMKKDLRQMWLLLTFYALIVTIATMRALSPPPAGLDTLEPVMIVLVMVGMIVIAAIVQADSPVRSEAFWATRPLYSSAVVVAKLATLVFVIMGIGAVGELIALRSLDLARGRLLALLAQALFTYAMWLLPAMTIAALTTDLRAFTTGLLALLIGMILTSLLAGPIIEDGPSPQVVFAVACVAAVGSAIFLAMLFKTHDTRRRLWVLGAVIAGCLLTATVVPTHEPAEWSAPGPPGAAIQLDGRLIDSASIQTRRDMHLILGAHGAPKNARVVLTNVLVTAHVNGGRTVVFPLPGSAFILQSGDSSIDNLRWLSRAWQTRQSVDVQVRIDSRHAVEMASGIRSLTLDGTLDVRTHHLAGTLPIKRGASFSRNDMRATVWKIDRPPGDINVQMHVMTLADNNGGPITTVGGSDPEFAIVNAERREAAGLQRTGGNTGTTPLVLPGVSVQDVTGDFSIAGLGAPTVKGIDDAWLQGAKLMIVEWLPVANHQVRVRVKL